METVLEDENNCGSGQSATTVPPLVAVSRHRLHRRRQETEGIAMNVRWLFAPRPEHANASGGPLKPAVAVIVLFAGGVAVVMGGLAQAIQAAPTAPLPTLIAPLRPGS